MTLEQTIPTGFPDAPQSKFKQWTLKVKFFLGSLFYLTYALYAYRYSRKRDRIERQFTPSQPPAIMGGPGKMLHAETTTNGAHFEFERASLDITFLQSDFVLVNWQPGLPPIPYGLAKPVDGNLTAWSPASIQLVETATEWMVYSDALRLQVDDNGGLRFYNSQEQLIRQEQPPRREGEAWMQQSQLRTKESIYGLGERAAALNIRRPNITDRKTMSATDTASSQKYRMWNYDAAGMYGPGADPMYICIPVYIGLHHQGSYLIFYENSFDAIFEFQGDVALVNFTGGSLRYYVAVGAPAQLLQRYTELTGRSPLPPQWALGYHQSRWGYRTEAAVRDTVRQFRALDLPLSAIHLDIDVQVDYRAFTIDPQRFPALGEFTQELLAQDVRFITILNPGIKFTRKSKLFLEGRMLEAFCKYPDGELAVAPVWCGWSAFPDFTNPLVRQWWSRQYEFMLDLGVAGFWHDMNEPAAFIAWGDRSLPKYTQHHMEGRGGDHREAHNVYGLLQARAGYESLCQYRSQQRPFIVSRAGWAGLQRYAWTWTGDIECTWDCLRQTIPTVLGLGLSGIPYSGPDIGGFQGNPEAELYLRWFQLATFLPFYRSHCSNNVEYRAPWTYGEPYLSIIRDCLKRRYRLMPYLYTLAWEAAQKGYPLARPMFWYNTDRPEFWNMEDAFYLGESLLIYPILEDGARSRSATLPPGRWYSFGAHADGEQVFEGPAQVELAAPLATIPVLVKAGTILPLTEQNELILHLYPPVEGEGISYLYSDAGDGYGEWRCDRLRLVRFADGLELFWEQNGDLPSIYPFPYQGIRLHFHGFQPQQAWIEGNEIRLVDQGANTAQTANYEISAPFKQAYFKGEFLVSSL